MPSQLAPTAPARASKTSTSKKPNLAKRATTTAAAATATTTTARASAAGPDLSSSSVSPRVEVTPALAEFINYDVDTSYVMPIEVRNRSQEILTFRFVAPTRHVSIFRLLNPASVRVAPGLAHVLEVEFSTHQAADYEDVLAVLSSDGGRTEVPLSACRVPQLEFPSLIDFGKVEQQHAAQTRALTLVNRGRKDAQVQFVMVPATNETQSPPRGISVSNVAAVAVAQSRTTVNIELNALPPGSYTWKVAVEVDGRRLPAMLEVVAEVMDCRSRLIDTRTHEEVVSLEFAETYAGNTKVHQLEVVNGGSQAISFAIQTAHTLSDEGAAPFHFTPNEGRLPPQGRQLVTAKFCPVLQPRRTGWSTATAATAMATSLTAAATATAATAARAGAKTSEEAAEKRRYEALFTLLFVETEQTQNFRLVGTSCETLVQLSTSSIDFGTCLMKGSKQSSLVITNAVAHLPMRFELRPPSHFSVTPARGVVAAGGTVDVNVEFHPRRLGPYEEPLTLRANDTVTRTVTLRGTSVHRIANDDDAAKATSIINATARTARHERALNEAAVPAAVDLGMIPAEGLTPPSLPLEVPPSVLHADGAGPRARQSNHVAPPVFGARSLVKRRYHPTPATTHERHDCRRELTPMEVLNVVLPLKALDFGRVTVHADVVASLFIFNGTAASILAAVPTDADGLVTVDPPSQVVPAQRMAQFDVHLCSRTVQTFQQVMRVAVNQQHFMRFNIQAEVVPVEVTLSQKEVHMALLGQAEDPVCTAQVTIGNSGNCAASYRWNLPATCEFDVEPRAGLLDAGEQRSILLRFSPAVGTSQAACEALLEVEGAVENKVLSLVGTVAATKCVWGPSPQMTVQESAIGAAALKEVAAVAGVLSLGRIAAGVSTTGTLVLVNKGRTNAYFSVGSLPPWVTVTPAQGRVCTGEAEELTVRVRQSVAGAVAHTVECMVVGMRKPLTAHVVATVVAPPLIVMSGNKEQSEVLLRFGEVYVGCPQSRSVVLRNTMEVAAAVSINLEACGHYTLDSPVMELDESEGFTASELGEAADAVRRSIAQSRLQSMRSLSVAEAATLTAAALVTVTPTAAPPGPRANIVVVPPNTDFALCLSYNPLKPSETARCAVRWHQIGADDLHPLPPFMLEAAAQNPPVVLSASSVTFAPVVVGQRPPPRIFYVRRGKESVSGHAAAAAAAAVQTGNRSSSNHSSSSASTPGGGAPLHKQPPVPWRLQRNVDDHNMLVEPSRGVLKPGEDEQAVTLTFLPSTAGTLQALLELKVGDEAGHDNTTVDGSDAPCGVCEVTASAIDPRVRSSTTALMFPTVPLGVAVQATVLLYNEGYDSIRVDYTGTCAPPLEVSFPQGHVMGRAPRDELPVTFTFCSPVPITVRSSIRLSTDAGGSVDIDICGSAVNSIVSTEMFVAYVTSTPSITASADTPYTWVDNSDATSLDNSNSVGAARILCALAPAERSTSRGRSAHDLVDVVEKEVDWEGEKEWLTAWWNVYVCRTPVGDIIEALQISRGGLIADMIGQLTGKRPRRTETDVATTATSAAAAFTTASGTSGRRKKQRASGGGGAAEQVHNLSSTAADVALSSASHAVPKELRSLDTLVSYLRNCGGCLSDIELPYLLPLDAYLEYMTEHHREVIDREVQHLEAAAAAGMVEESVLATVFQQRATASWLVMMRESVRLFYVSQVRGTAIVAPPALMGRWASAPFRRTLARSNVYSEEESVLLRWVEAATATFVETERSDVRDMLHVTAPPQQLEDLRDARRLLAVVLAYVPFLASQVREGLLNVMGAAGAAVASGGITGAAGTAGGGGGGDAASVAAGGGAHEPTAVAVVLMHVLHLLGVPGLPTPMAFVSATPTRLVLLLTHLYLYLPKFAASTPVCFSGRALTTLTETISVDNTSEEQRHYRVLLPDNSPFRPAAEELVVSPRSSATLTFTVVPRTQRPLQGQCALIDRSPQASPAERMPFVFLLTAAPTAEPLRTIQVSTPLYEPLQSELQIENPFPVNCVVSLRVSQRRLPAAERESDVARSPAMPWLYEEQESYWRAGHDTPFVVASDVLSLRRGETTRLPFSFLPLSRGTYRLLLTFHEEKEGEFTYAVEATCGWPKPVDAGVELRVEQGEQCASVLSVKSTNAALERCLKVYEDRAHRTQRTDLGHLLSGATYAVYFVNDEMEGPNPFFSPDINSYESPTSPAATGTLPFTFCPQSVGVYRTLVLLLSAVEVRLLRLVGECVPKGDCRELQFVCPARQSIAQQITLTNHTANDWFFTATLEGSSHFSGPHDVRVPSGRSKDYTIKYSPTWITTESDVASLLLLNSTTGQKHAYTLQGKAEPPLSEGIVNVDCRAREHEVVELMVPNIVSQDATYFVKMDLAYCEGESPTLVIPRASARRYTIQVKPTVGGDYTGRVSFTSPHGRYVWYAVQLHVDPPEKEGTVELKTDVRTSMVAEVTVTNPLDTPLFFKVQRYGAGLYGANTFQLGPKAASTYGVLFVPTQVGESTGRLSLVSDVVGEFWYELRMKVTEAAPEPLPFATTPLGLRQIMQVHLPNRTNASCILTVESTNPSAFNTATPARVVLAANAETVVDLVYVPNTVGVEQKATVTLRHPELGCWRYACTGTGAPPLPAEPLTCNSTVGATALVTLPFVNVLSKDTALEVRLKNASPAFSLRTVPPGPVAAGAAAPITVAFAPTLVKRDDATVEVRPLVGATDRAYNAVWVYPIRGFCEYRQSSPPLRLRCAARTQWEDKVYLHAPGLTPELADGVTPAFEVDANQSYRDTAATSVSCVLTTPSPYPDGFEVQLRFFPLRPFIGSGWIVLQGVDGGVWRYRVQFEATTAAPDDTIVLHGEYKETTAATFDLHNVFPYRSPFFAYFTAESSKDLSVTPTHGVLLPFVPGQRGAATATSMQLTVKPSSRIPQVEGTLVIDTDDMQWIFRVVGKFGHQSRATN
ncbi:hypothetical protein ABB37_00163 [Leptomonas pyrrhocoris]|uniref:Abnormal spindle-like microcephaly-associated protein ASH domain-containing protein n=1 Tax=Leptomonas pyrrhocoris TaxID=157538 RepID=A0A0N0DZY7_LEPPY|nr:hypothetical protein ABB37_00163 [Leptomonas pyrrhocoris]XP_015664264.1 hypothetical protein ABB37_00163 [Leptomonas pyrrhocoris]KPA85824.1 hypothetical protein ABB37_00163 [Leptomonas pyrrhocoris]KPA85825.1 hypothetical protein ABB37_00163 [Leptomonas pyrrhocoris]|eukprot:XP_015664263.1 hypothetical protein ABB37_00163 [Leptomonas pyrrhocoris]